MKKITETEAQYIVELCAAAKKLPRVQRGLNAKSKHYDAFYLELSAAEMSDGIGQG